MFAGIPCNKCRKECGKSGKSQKEVQEVWEMLSWKCWRHCICTHYTVSGNGASMLPLGGCRVHCPQYPCLVKVSQHAASAHRVLWRVALVRTAKRWGKVISAPAAEPAHDDSLNIPCNSTSGFWD